MDADKLSFVSFRPAPSAAAAAAAICWRTCKLKQSNDIVIVKSKRFHNRCVTQNYFTVLFLFFVLIICAEITV